MRRFLPVLIVLLAGCVPQSTVPTADDFTPWVAVAMGVTASVPDKPDNPSAICENCGGVGYLGDGTIRRDCPECETDWQQLPEEIKQR